MLNYKANVSNLSDTFILDIFPTSCINLRKLSANKRDYKLGLNAINVTYYLINLSDPLKILSTFKGLAYTT